MKAVKLFMVMLFASLFIACGSPQEMSAMDKGLETSPQQLSSIGSTSGTAAVGGITGCPRGSACEEEPRYYESCCVYQNGVKVYCAEWKDCPGCKWTKATACAADLKGYPGCDSGNTNCSGNSCVCRL